MKKSISFIALILMMGLFTTSYAQAPQKFNYQALVRDNAGNIIANHSVGLRVTIHEGSANGTIVYQETHSVNTNQFGLVTLEIGTGNQKSISKFSSIDWSKKSKYIQIGVDAEGGSNYTDIGASELLSVPYALYSEKSGGTSDNSKLDLWSRDDTYKSLSPITSGDGLLFTGTIGTTPVSGAGSRMMWIPAKKAFRAGTVTGTNRDNDSIGNNSVAFGYDSKAKSPYSFAAGYGTSASNNYAFATGYYSVASGLGSYAAGNRTSAIGYLSYAVGTQTVASGKYSVAMGFYTYAKSFSSTVFGRYNIISGDSANWVSTDPLFILGNGTSVTNRSNAFTVYKNGNAEIKGVLKITGGTPGAGKVLTSDASGNSSWQTPVPVGFSGNFDDLTNKPTTISGYGITDAVTTTGDQTIAGNKTFTGTVTVNTPVDNTDATNKAYVDALKNTIYQEMLDAGLNGTVKDVDGNYYKTIKIGTQVWMAQDLKVAHYRNGDAIPNTTDETQWNNLTTGAYCDYNNTPSNSITFGKLYNWYAVNDSRNICPTGWHVPSDAEWTSLTTYLGSSYDAMKLKEAGTAHWPSPNTATNETGFSALPSGTRSILTSGGFCYINSITKYWSATVYNTTYSWHKLLDSSDFSDRNTSYKVDGLSVRCLRD